MSPASRVRQATRKADDRRHREEIKQAAGDELRRSMLPRGAAAVYCGLKESTLRDWWAAGDRGPAGVKIGSARQSRVFYPIEELDRWRADPLGYSRRSRPENIGPFEPPHRGNGRRK